MGMMRSCARHSVCFLSFTMWVLGCALMGCMLWVLATSPALRGFFMGTTIFTYVVIGVGGLLFLNGLLGWIGSYRRGNCVMKLFLLVAVLTVAAEVGGIVAFNILNLKMTDILENGWKEVNDNTRNIVQDQLHCCGFLGPEDFTVNTDPIHESCYTNLATSNSTTEVRKLNRVGCKERLLEWFYTNKYIWISTLGGVLLFQVASVLFAVYLINQLSRSRRSSSGSLNMDIDPMTHHHHPQPYF